MLEEENNLERWIWIPNFEDYDDFKCSYCGYILEKDEEPGNFCPLCHHRMIPYEFIID